MHANIDFLDQFPFPDGLCSWWPTSQVVPLRDSKLGKLFVVCYVAFCMVQIAIMDYQDKKPVKIGRVSNWSVCRPTQQMQESFYELAREIQEEEEGDAISEMGSTVVPETMAGVWQTPSSSGGTWPSSSSSAMSSSAATSSSWAMVATGQMDLVPEIVEDDE